MIISRETVRNICMWRFACHIVVAIMAIYLIGCQEQKTTSETRSEQKKEELVKVEPITKEGIIGAWEGKNKSGAIRIDFSKEAEGIAVVSYSTTKEKPIHAIADYTIDSEKNEILVGGAVIKPTNDGTLLLSGTIKTKGIFTFSLTETKLERLKPSDSNK